VIIAAYHHERWVRRTLDSLLEDGYPNLELVVIDDGSTDGTARVIGDWLDANGQRFARIDFHSRPNRGVTATANELLGRARGLYVVPLASDDYLLPGGIAWRLACFDASPGLEAVFGDCVVVDAGGDLLFDSAIAGLYRADKRRLTHHLTSELITNFVLPGPVVMYRREVFIGMGGYDEALLVEDWDFYLRFAARGTLAFTDRTVAGYRLHGSNSKVNPTYRRRWLSDIQRVVARRRPAFTGRSRLLLDAQGLAARVDQMGSTRICMRLGSLAARVIRRLAIIAARILDH
jgi:glycosyltransferase involved in cell wall biosynthesis